MRANIATIRELRTDFRSVKRRIEQHGELIITDHGEPAYVLKPVRQKPTTKSTSPPDYYSRLRKRQPKALSAEATRRFWEEERR